MRQVFLSLIVLFIISVFNLLVPHEIFAAATCPTGQGIYNEGDIICNSSDFSQKTYLKCQSDGNFSFASPSQCPGGGTCEVQNTNPPIGKCIGPTATPTSAPSAGPCTIDGRSVPNQGSICEDIGGGIKRIATCNTQRDPSKCSDTICYQACQAPTNICVETGTSAACAIPTPTSTPTNTPTPTATPLPDPAVKCTYPGDSSRTDDAGNPIQYDDRSILCTGDLYGGYDVEQCQKTGTGKGEFVRIGLCSLGLGLSICSRQTPVTKGDICDGYFTIPDDIACRAAEPDFGQDEPKPGQNCGLAIDSNVQPLSGEKNSPDNPVYSCCFPKALINKCADTTSLQGLEGVPGFLTNMVKAGIQKSAGQVNIPGVGTMQDVTAELEKIPPCLVGKPSIGTIDSSTIYTETANAGVPGCYCALNTALANSTLCKNVTDDGTETSERSECEKCLGYDVTNGTYKMDKVYTALGCIDTSPQGFIQSSMGFGVSVGGAFALTCIIYAAFLLQTSSGNPERVKKGRDLITSCISGLLLIIFSVFILRLIGYNILRIPGFG